MNKILGTLVITIMMVGCMGFPLGDNAHAISLDFVPTQPMAIATGGNYNVDITMSGLDAAGEIVSTFDLDILFDETLLSVTGVDFGFELGDPLWFEAITDWGVVASGLLDLANLSLLSDTELDGIQGDTVLLATVSFSGVGDGDTSLAFANWGQVNDIKGRNNQVIYNPIPEPSTLLLMGIGLSGLAAFTRKKRE